MHRTLRFRHLQRAECTGFLDEVVAASGSWDGVPRHSSRAVPRLWMLRIVRYASELELASELFQDERRALADLIAEEVVEVS